MKTQTHILSFYNPGRLPIFSIAIVLTIILFSASCVSKRRYNEAKMAEGRTKAEKAKLETDVKNLVATNANLETQNAACQSKVTDLNGEIGLMENINQSKNSELKMSKEQLIAEHNRLVDLQKKIAQQQKYTEAIRAKIANALVNYKPDELMVSVKKGKVYVSMQEALLFPSGSAKLNQKGKDAIRTVAEVLKDNPDINVNIEGHTDPVKIHTAIFPDNWELSTARATTIAHLMIDDYSIQPERITASGRSHFDPVADNSTAGGRQLNRRTEIILEPKLNELMDLIYSTPPVANSK